MQNMMGMLIIGTASLLFVIATISLAIFSERRFQQAEAREASYREKRREFIATWRAFEQLPFYPWKIHFPRLEPFAKNDAQVLLIANRANQTRNAFATLPARLLQGDARVPGFWALLVDVPGNIHRLRQWREDEKSIRAAEALFEQLKQAQTEIEKIFQCERALRQAVSDNLDPLRQAIENTAKAPRALAGERAEQVSALITDARDALAQAEEALKAAPADDAPLDNGIRFTLAYLAKEMGTLFLRHVELVDSIVKETSRVNETALFGQVNDLYQFCRQLAALRLEPVWETLRAASENLEAQKARLEALQRELQKQVDEAIEYWEGLDLFLNEVIVEIQRVDTAEAGLAPYLGRIEDVPQAWEQITSMRGRVSDQLKFLRHDLEGLTRSDEARRASSQNWTRFHADRDRFYQLKEPAAALQDKLAELRREQRRLQASFEGEGRAAQLLIDLQNVTSDCPIELYTELITLINRLNELKTRLEPQAGVNYRVLAERLDNIEADGKKMLADYQGLLSIQRERAAVALKNFETLHARFLQLKIRTPRIEKDWSAVEQWVNHLAEFAPNRAGFSEIDGFMKTYQLGYDDYDLQVGKVEQIYRDFDDRVSKITRNASRCHDALVQQAVTLETSPWSLMYILSSQALRQYSAAYGQQIELAQAACANPHIAEAVKGLDQVEHGVDAVTEQANKVITGYRDNFNDLMDKLRYYSIMREKYIANHAYNGSGTVTLNTADSYRDLALRTLDYATARQALLDAQKFLGQF